MFFCCLDVYRVLYRPLVFITYVRVRVEDSKFEVMSEVMRFLPLHFTLSTIH